MFPNFSIDDSYEMCFLTLGVQAKSTSASLDFHWILIGFDFSFDFDGCSSDILDFDCKTFKAAFGVPDFIWGSPDCRHYSKVRNSMPHIPRDIEGSNKLVLKLLQIIKFFYNHNNHLVFFIENPQTGLLKKQDFMSNIPYEVVSYCKYGFNTLAARQPMSAFQTGSN